MNSNKCKSCGYGFNSNDQKCIYCGSSNPNYKKPVTNPIQSFIDSNFNSNDNQSTNNNSSPKNSEINICVLVILAIIFWPLAIIYALVKSSKK